MGTFISKRVGRCSMEELVKGLRESYEYACNMYDEKEEPGSWSDKCRGDIIVTDRLFTSTDDAETYIRTLVDERGALVAVKLTKSALVYSDDFDKKLATLRENIRLLEREINDYFPHSRHRTRLAIFGAGSSSLSHVTCTNCQNTFDTLIVKTLTCPACGGHWHGGTEEEIGVIEAFRSKAGQLEADIGDLEREKQAHIEVCAEQSGEWLWYVGGITPARSNPGHWNLFP